MDFASGLANLEQSAANAQNRRRGRDNQDDNNRDDHRRYQARPRRDNYHPRDNNNYDRGGRHNNNNSNNRGDRSLDGLARFGYRLPRSPYHRPPPISAHNSDRPLHICLLAITIDELPYEHIWKAWAADASKNSRYHVSLVCHAKYPDKVTSKWLQQRMLLHPRRIVRGNSLSDPEFLSHQPAWGSVEITRAMIDLLVAAMQMGRKGERNKDHEDPRFHPNRFCMTADNDDEDVQELAKRDVPPVDKFIFISETCIPVTTLEETVQALFFGPKCFAARPKFTPPPPKKPAAEGDAKEEAQFAADKQEEEDKDKPNSDEAAAKEEQGAKGEDEDNEKEGSEEKEKDDNEEKEESDTKSTSEPKNEESDDKTTKETAKEDKNSTMADATTTTATPSSYKMIYLDVSWVNARNFNSPNTPSNKYERDQFNGINRVVPKRYRWKADQWMCLSRTHAAAILDLDRNGNIIPPKDQLWNSFRRINASDEMYFPTALALAGVLVDTSTTHNNSSSSNNNNNSAARSPLKWTPPPGVPPPKQDESKQAESLQPPPPPPKVPPPKQQSEGLAWLEQRRITYTDWSMGARNPACFTKGVRDFRNIARLAREQKCLLARKFAPFQEIPGQDKDAVERTGEISVEEWKQEMQTIVEQTNKE